jgi:DNA-binding SARP family transcriptional activator/tetratricopeptide (TPR) repeat protein
MRVRLLDTVRLEGPDGPVELGRPQQRCVFTVLAMTPGQTVPVETLIERVWGPRPPRDARTALYSYVSRLRGVLRRADPDGQASLRRLAGGYALEVDPDRVDLHRVRRLAQQARAALAATDGVARAADLLAEACAWWPGPGTPLAGVSGDWVDRVRAGLEHEWLALVAERFDAEIRAGRHDSIIGPLSEAWATHPLAESLAGLLMLALYRSGSHADALEVYRTLRRRMVDELGDEPGPALRTMQERILRRDPALDLAPEALATRLESPSAHDAAAVALQPGGDPVDQPGAEVAGAAGARLLEPWVPLCQLPPAPAHFVGRRDLVDRLIRELRGPSGALVAVVTITGAPGIGKTALATVVAHAVREDFPDGQWYVRLGTADPERILGELLEASGVDSGMVPEGVERRAAALRSRLAGRRVLLVLDDVEAAAQVRPLLPGTAGAAVLVTSRNRLAGLAEVSGAARLEPLTDQDARELLSRLAGPERVRREPDAAAELCSSCGGLPLALRIAAARLAAHPGWTVRRLASRLGDQRHRLDELAVDDLSVRAGLDLSYHALDDAGQSALRHLAAFGNHPVAAWTAGVLAGGDGERVVSSLNAASLLDGVGVDATGEPRYRLHDLVATYAAELAVAQPDQARAAARRHLDALLAAADAAYRRLHVDTTDMPAAPGPVPAGLPAGEVARLTADPVAWLVSERPQLETAIERACRFGWHADAAALADRVLTHVLRVHLGPHGIRRLYRMIGESARTAGDELVAWRAEARLCTELAVSGQIAAAADGLGDCADAFERLGADAELAFSLGASATYRRLLGGGAELLPRVERALEIARGCGVKPEVDATRQLAAMLAGLGRRAEALPLFERALELADKEDLIADRTVTLLGMAGAAYAHGDLDHAEAASDRAMELVDGTTDPRGVAYLLLLTARIAAAREHHRDAIEAAEEAVGWFTDLGDVLGEAHSRGLLGRLCLAGGEPARAVPLLESAAYTLHSVGMFAAHTDTLSTLTRARAASLHNT